MHCTGGPGHVEHRLNCECSVTEPRLILHGRRPYACLGNSEKYVTYHCPVFDSYVARSQQWFVFKPCVCNHMNALLRRVNKCVPKHSVTAIRTILSPLASQLAKGLGRHTPISYFDVYKNMDAKKRRRYQRAEEDLQHQGGVVYKHQAKIEMFVKLEGIKFAPNKVNPDCRAIQFRKPIFTLAMAAAIKKAEHALYAAADIPGFPTTRFIAKGLNPQAKATLLKQKFDSLSGCWVLELDASRFDAHCNIDLLKFVEHLVWKKVCLDPQIGRLCAMQLINKGSFRVGDFVQLYTVRGGRMSGDANTAAGNCILMSVLLASFGAHLNCPFDFLCDGDDSVFFYKRAGPVVEGDVVAWFEQFGMDMKIEGMPKTFEEITFCQSRPVKTSEGWVMARDPFKILSKIGCSHKLWDPKARVKYIRTVALGEHSLARGVPVVDPFLRRIVEVCDDLLTPAQKKRGLVHKGAIADNFRLRESLSQGWTTLVSVPITSCARESFARAWGIPINNQLLIEESISEFVLELVQTRTGDGIDLRRWLFSQSRPECW